MGATGPRLLAVQPWVHDFAAYDFWARPLGLLALVRLFKALGCRVDFLDCLGAPDASRAKSRQGRAPYPKQPIPKPPGLADVPRTWSRYGRPPEAVRQDLAALPRPDAVLVTCMMAYWYPGAAEAMDEVRAAFPGVPLILGGVYPSLWPKHAATLGADETVSGTDPALAVAAVERTTGWTAPPLPAQVFPVPDPACLGDPPAFVPVLTGLGCPLRCAYCASGLLWPGFVRRDPEEVAGEILDWHGKCGVRDFAFYDDALLVDAENHVVPLLARLAESGTRLRFHTPNALHVGRITPRLARLMARAGFSTIRLGLETARERGGLDQKVAQGEFERAARSLVEAGFGPDRAGAYLLAGLPGQDEAALAESVQAVKKAGLFPIPAWYSPIPNTPLWEEALQASRYDLAVDPLYTNNAIQPCSKEPFSWERISRLKEMCKG